MYRVWKNTIGLLSLLAILATVADARSRKVLFIGNSYIYTNDIPAMIKQLADSTGDTLIYDQNTPGGYTLQQHSTDATTISKIKSQKWDIVILQEQSQKPAFSPGQVAAETYPYAKQLDSMIRDNNACTETMFYMTWGRKNGDASNCAAYLPICTYAGMQQRLRESYLQMAQDNKAIVAPVGAVWKMVRDSLPAINLYMPDESHPSVYGGYLSACVFYASIFHRNPHGNKFISTLSATDAERIQYFAGKVVSDSLDQWQQYGNYVYTDFDHSITNANTRAFQNHCKKATTYQWDFGDMNTGAQPDPSHTYAQKGIYKVRLTASNTCFSEMSQDTVNIGSVDVPSLGSSMLNVVVRQQGGGRVSLDVNGTAGNLTIYAADGRLVRQINTMSRPVITLELTPGIYVYTLLGGQWSVRDKFAVY